MLINPCCCDSECVFFTDDFDRADDTDLGDDWTEDSGSWEIDTNRLVCTVAGMASCDNDMGPGGPTSIIAVAVSATLRSSSADKLGLMWFYNPDTANWYFAELTLGGGARIDIYEHLGGADTLIAYTTGISASTGLDHEFKVAVDANGNCLMVSVYLNDEKVLTVLRNRNGFTFDMTKIRCGVTCSSTSGGATFDDFRIEWMQFSGGFSTCDTFWDCGWIPGTNDQARVIISGAHDVGAVCPACPTLDGSYILDRDGNTILTTCPRYSLTTSLPCGMTGLEVTVSDHCGTPQGDCLVAVNDAGHFNIAHGDIYALPAIDFGQPYALGGFGKCNPTAVSVEPI